jgi:hypothetical protein
MKRIVCEINEQFSWFYVTLTAGLLLVCSGCATSGTIRAAAVDSTFRRVADRHDKYINADPTLSDLEKRVDLRDTAVLRGVLDEANKPTTQAVK